MADAILNFISLFLPLWAAAAVFPPAVLALHNRNLDRNIVFDLRRVSQAAAR